MTVGDYVTWIEPWERRASPGGWGRGIVVNMKVLKTDREKLMYLDILMDCGEIFRIRNDVPGLACLSPAAR